jgi:glycerophosphoryl diester phosphodiesterase
MPQWYQPYRRITNSLKILSSLALVCLLTAMAAHQYLTISANDFFTGAPPRFFYEELPEDFAPASAIGIAHNSGNRMRTMDKALDHGARSVEIDVIATGGKLYAAHKSSPPIARLLYRGIPLSKVWKAADEAEIVKLDLKKSAARRPDLVEAFLEKHYLDGQTIYVTSSNEKALARLGESDVPLIRLLSVRGKKDLARLLTGTDARGFEGVSIRHTLLDRETADWLQERELLVFAWTVNSPSLLENLLSLGIHGLMTDNLAIASLLGVGPGPKALVADADADDISSEP